MQRENKRTGEILSKNNKQKKRKHEATKELNKTNILEQCVDNCGFCRHFLKRTNENKGR